MMQSFLEAVREILVTVLIEEWYWGIALTILVLLGFVILLEHVAKSLGKAWAIVIGFCGMGLYVWLVIALFAKYMGFSIGLIVVALLYLYYGYYAYFSKSSKRNKK